MSTLTDRYCPHCFRQLREGRKNWYWCPNDYVCGFECDVAIDNRTISKLDSLTRHRDKLELKMKSLIESHQCEILRLQGEIDSIDEQAPQG